MTEATVDDVLEPMRRPSAKWIALVVVTGLVLLWFMFAWVTQLRGGLLETGLGDWGSGGGVPWGMYIGTFVWWIGIAHGGIAISAAVRVFRVERFKPIARIAEVLTVIALMMAAANIVFDLGRPDRLFNTLVAWPQTVHHSPLAWDIAVVTLYLVLSLTYLVLTLRPDLYALRDRMPRYLWPLHRALTLGYSPEENEKAEQMAWWLAVAILALVPLLSGGVVPWLFGLIGAQPGWYGAMTGPSMLAESLTTAIAMVIIVAAVFRYVYDWEFIDREVFLGLVKILAVLSLATLWMVLHDTLSGIYAAPDYVESLTISLLNTPIFWVAVGGLVVTTLYLIAVLLRPQLFHMGALVVACTVIAFSIFSKKVLFVVEGLLYPTTPPLSNQYPTGSYAPTWVEWSLVLGSVVIAIFMFAIVVKLIPMVEVDVDDTAAATESAAVSEQTSNDQPVVEAGSEEVSHQ